MSKNFAHSLLRITPEGNSYNLYLLNGYNGLISDTFFLVIQQKVIRLRFVIDFIFLRSLFGTTENIFRMDTETKFTLVSYNYWMVKTTFPAPSFF